MWEHAEVFNTIFKDLSFLGGLSKESPPKNEYIVRWCRSVTVIFATFPCIYILFPPGPAEI